MIAEVAPTLIADGLAHYHGEHAFGYRELSINLAAKIQHHELAKCPSPVALQDECGRRGLAPARSAAAALYYSDFERVLSSDVVAK